MQTKQQIQQLLSLAGVWPKKRFGQHFLIDLNLMRLLVDSAGIRNSDVVLEVGCGTGSLTQALAGKAGKVIAVEVDRTLAIIAKKQLEKQKNVEIISTDILENKHTISGTIADAVGSSRRNCPGRFLLVANLPYSAACPVMLNLVTGPTTVDAMYVTVQKEIAQRMTAGPGDKDYGSLAILLAATGDIKTIRVLKPTVFWPQPEVDSAMVSFVRDKDKTGRIENMGLFSEVISAFMGHRRKMLKTSSKLARGSLAEIRNWDEIFQRCSVDPTNRPEQLSPEDYIAIANLCYEHHKQQIDENRKRK